jgi:hypothetical protein
LNKAETFAAENFGTLDDAALVSVRVAAAVKNCCEDAIWRRIRDGRLASVKDGRMRRIKVSSLRASMKGDPL